VDEDDDLLMAMARELVQERGSGVGRCDLENLRKQQEEVFSIRVASRREGQFFGG
jgi:hypothetical protein